LSANWQGDAHLHRKDRVGDPIRGHDGGGIVHIDVESGVHRLVQRVSATRRFRSSSALSTCIPPLLAFLELPKFFPPCCRADFDCKDKQEMAGLAKRSDPYPSYIGRCGINGRNSLDGDDSMKPENPTEEFQQHRRQFFGTAAMAIAAAQFGRIVSAQAQSAVNNTARWRAKRNVAGTSFPALKQINAGLLDVGYVDLGPANGPPVLLLHGWPYDIYSFVDVAPLLARAGYRVIVPYLRGYGTTRLLSADTVRNGQPSVVALDIVALMDVLNIRNAIIGGFDWGARTANIIGALWPERCRAMVSVSGYLIGSQADGAHPLPPNAEFQWWYQFYFATERGREGYDKYRREFSKLIWQLASPKWHFDDATFARSAAAFDNSDHVDIVIHNYRWRQGLAQGEAKYDALEARLAQAPVIGIPTITMEGDANGAPHPEPTAYRNKFSGKYAHRTITGGIGHDLPQEAPQAFAQAIIDVAAL
jgi:pimeloyl-ACP methyl ester carboxylesterase